MSDYDRIARAIDFLRGHAGDQPSLSAVSAHVHLSPYHFQRLFSRWVGVTPKRFLQVLTVEHAKQLLAQTQVPLLDVAYATGLSGASRLHDHFVQLEAATPAEYRKAGAGLTIRHGICESPFGRVFIATTSRGVCAVSFVDADSDDPLMGLRRDWPGAELVKDASEVRRVSHALFDSGRGQGGPLSLLVRGTNFQVNVWRALLRIPPASVVSYHDVACAIGKPSAARAVGRAVGANPIAFAIPCHRVIRQSGELGGYRWGVTRKLAIHSWEHARQT